MEHVILECKVENGNVASSLHVEMTQRLGKTGKKSIILPLVCVELTESTIEVIEA